MTSTIRTYLRRERRKWGLTQRDLAQLVGLKSRARISDLEQGSCLPTAEQLLAFQLIFGMTAPQLFPHLAAEEEASVLGNAATIMKSMESNLTLRAKRKHDCLRQIQSRAVMSQPPNPL